MSLLVYVFFQSLEIVKVEEAPTNKMAGDKKLIAMTSVTSQKLLQDNNSQDVIVIPTGSVNTQHHDGMEHLLLNRCLLAQLFLSSWLNNKFNCQQNIQVLSTGFKLKLAF